MTAKQYLDLMVPMLAEKLNGLEVVNEWRAFRGLSYQYSPIADIAVGPFSIAPAQNQTSKYNEILEQEPIIKFLQKIYDYHIENIGDDWTNELKIPNLNARCFLSIEIENKNSKKHIMGSVVNAASLGRIGIGVAYCDSAKRTFIRILNYMAFLKRVGKNTYDTTNF